MWDYKSLAKKKLGENQIDVKSVWKIEDAHFEKAKRKVKVIKLDAKGCLQEDSKVSVTFFIPHKVKIEEDTIKQEPYTPASTPINARGSGNG